MFWLNYTDLCSNIGKSPNAVAKELSLSSGSVTSWKNGSVPHFPTLKKIADYFGVTVDDLLRPVEKTEQPTVTDELSAEKKALIDFALGVPEEKAKQVLRVLKAIVESDE